VSKQENKLFDALTLWHYFNGQRQ